MRGNKTKKTDRKTEGEKINLVPQGDKEQTLEQDIMEVKYPIEKK